jgi:hypothetical protein
VPVLVPRQFLKQLNLCSILRSKFTLRLKSFADPGSLQSYECFPKLDLVNLTEAPLSQQAAGCEWWVIVATELSV